MPVTGHRDCIGRYGGLAMFWRDQTKVGNNDAAIRIPERVYDLLAGRQRKTLDRFTARYGYRPAGGQRAELALFPTIYRSQDATVSLTHEWFYSRFRPWVDAMDLGHYVPHQARHTLATSLQGGRGVINGSPMRPTPSPSLCEPAMRLTPIRSAGTHGVQGRG